MKRKKVKRINASFISFKEFLAVFSVILLACASFHWLYLMYQGRTPENPVVASSALLGIQVFISLFATTLIGFGKKYIFGRPMQRIAEAANQVARGDFSVRVQSFRKDGKKDEIEVLVEDFNKMAEELSTIETLKADFIANVSHEIKAPLSVIQSYAMAIQDDTLQPEDRREYGKTIVEASRKLSVLISNILKLNKIENQEIFPESEPYVLSEQLRECVLAFEELWENKNISFVGDEIAEIVVTYDRTLLELVWNNLISNAIKFTEDGGEVTLTLKDENGCAVVTIKDTGCGMSEETAKRIFDKFYQGDTSHYTEGNGLGLALAKKVIDVVGGEIYVISHLNGGSSFIVKLKI